MLKAKLLIVDDDQGIVRAFERCFKHEYDVTTAFTLEAATAVISMVDVVLSDWNIGPVTPVDLIGKKPMVVMTGRPEAAQEVIAGRCQVLTKPASNDDVRNAIKAALAK